MSNFGLSKGGLTALWESDGELPTLRLQVLNGRYFPAKSTSNQESIRPRFILSDSINMVLAFGAQNADISEFTKDLTKHDIIELTSYVKHAFKGKRILLISSLKVVDKAPERIGNPVYFQGSGAKESLDENNRDASPSVDNNKPLSTTTNTTTSYSNTTGSSNSNLGGKPKSTIKSSGQAIYPIEAISPYQNKWTIKARVSLKSEMRTWHNQRGEGRLFNVNFLDESGEIRATAFNEQADQFYDLLQEGKVYYVTKARVNLAKRQFNNLSHSYELSLDRETDITPCYDVSDDVPKVNLNLVKLDKIQQVEANAIIDVMGVVKEIGEIRQLTAKTTGKPYDKRDLTIVDESQYSIRITLWNKSALEFNGKENDIIGFKAAKVSDFGGKSLSLTPGSSMIINPDTTEAHGLKGWYDMQGSHEAFKTFTSDMSAATGRIEERKTILQVKEEHLGASERPDYFRIKASIRFIRDQAIAYPACAEEGCNKKVIETSSGTWRCESMDKEFDNPVYRYIITISVVDHTDQLWLSCFDDVGRILFGKPANEVVNLKENYPQSFSNVISEATGKEYEFRVRAKQDNYQGQERIRYQVLSASPINYSADADALVEKLGKLLQD